MVDTRPTREVTDYSSDRRTFLQLLTVATSSIAGCQGGAIESIIEDRTRVQNLTATGYDGTPILSSDQNDVVVRTENEPNDAKNTADRVNLRSEIKGSIDDSDTDWYAFDVRSRRSITLNLFKSSSDGKLSVVLYGPDGSFIDMVYLDDATAGHLNAGELSPGSYLVRVVMPSTGAGQYRIRFTEGDAEASSTDTPSGTASTTPDRTNSPTSTGGSEGGSGNVGGGGGGGGGGSGSTETDTPTTTGTATQTPTETATPTPTSTQEPYFSTPKNLPGTVEAEDYDEGGEGVAYHDDSADNQGGEYRTDGVDIESTDDTGGGYSVGWIEHGEWLEYTVDVPSGTYDIKARVASADGDNQISVHLNGNSLGTLDVPNTGDWQVWETTSISDISVSGGDESVLRLTFSTNDDSTGFNINWIAFVSSDTSTPTSTPTPTDTPTPTATPTGDGPTILGETKLWHRVGLQWTGPAVTEDDSTNPFTDYRMDVTWTAPSGAQYVVPGHFAADGDAANTGTSSGDQWRVWFNPDEVGTWSWSVSFTSGADVAIDGGGTATAFDGQTGTIDITATDKAAPDYRALGTLEHIGEQYYRFAGTGEYWVKAGADSPENFLGYYEFDQTASQGGDSPPTPSNLHEFVPHEGDFNSGDPTWGQLDGATGTYGQGIIGAVNYLASVGVNSQYFITYNIDGGDGQDVWPWTSTAEKERYDVSKLDQWEIVFSHMERQGVAMHFLFRETENDEVMDGGSLGRENKLYYREMVSRFAHHNALQWNIGEEIDFTTTQLTNHLKHLRSLDPYDHPQTFHTLPTERNKFDNHLGEQYIDAISIQDNNNTDLEDPVFTWWDKSESAGDPWFIGADEMYHWQVGIVPDGETIDGIDQVHQRKFTWPAYLNGGNFEAYFGNYNDQPDTDSTADDRRTEDFRTRANWWEWQRHMHDFMMTLPFWTMSYNNDESFISSSANEYGFEDPGNTYAVYFDANVSDATVNLPSGDWTVEWWDPVNGWFNQTDTVTGGGDVNLTIPSTLDDAAARITPA